MTTHAQRIAAYDEQMTNNGLQLAAERKLRAALASAQADRGRLENALAEIADMQPPADVYKAYDQLFAARKLARVALDRTAQAPSAGTDLPTPRAQGSGTIVAAPEQRPVASNTP